MEKPNQVSIIEIVVDKDGQQVIKPSVMVHENTAKQLIEHNGYTELRKHGYILEEDFKKDYQILKEDERQTNNSPEGVVPVDNAGTTGQGDNASGNGNELSRKPKGERSPRKPKK